jgi:hypothetical protein
MTTFNRPTLIAMIVAATLAVAGCGKDSGSAGAPGSPSSGSISSCTVPASHSSASFSASRFQTSIK